MIIRCISVYSPFGLTHLIPHITILTLTFWHLGHECYIFCIYISPFRNFKNNSSFLKTYDLATSLTSISSSHRHHLCRTFKNICSNYSKTLTLDSSLIIWKTWSTNKNLSNVPFKALLHLFKYPLSSLIFLANILKRMRYFRVL